MYTHTRESMKGMFDLERSNDTDDPPVPIGEDIHARRDPKTRKGIEDSKPSADLSLPAASSDLREKNSISQSNNNGIHNKRTKKDDEVGIDFMELDTIANDDAPVPTSRSIENSKTQRAIENRKTPCCSLQENSRNVLANSAASSVANPMIDQAVICRNVVDTFSQRAPSAQFSEAKEIFVPEAIVVEESSQKDIIPAELVVPERYSITIAGRKVNCGVIVLVVVLLSLIVGLSLGLTRSSPTIDNPNGQSSAESPTESPRSHAIKEYVEKEILKRGASFESMAKSNPRYLALNYIIEDDLLKLDVGASNLSQRYILALLSFQSMSLGSNIDWLSPKNECEWIGVTCTGGFANELNLGGDIIDLRGTIPPEIVGLQLLRYLSMNSNSLFGTLPPEIGDLEELYCFDVSDNGLTGSIPSEFGRLKNLQYWLLQGNKLTGTLPSEIKSLKYLSRLDMYDNSLSGTLPSEIGSLKELTFFSVSDNGFTGTLPSEIGGLKNLSELYIPLNHFTGTIPPELGNLTSLESFWLHENNFSGSLPTELGYLRSLKDLDLSYNQFTGLFPTEIGSLNLSDFCINDNLFTGVLPPQIGDTC